MKRPKHGRSTNGKEINYARSNFRKPNMTIPQLLTILGSIAWIVVILAFSFGATVFLCAACRIGKRKQFTTSPNAVGVDSRADHIPRGLRR
jgi:hypothetical protein